MSAVVITGDTSGTVTLQAPAVAGTTTLTLPATNGTIVTTASGQSLASPAITGTATLNGVNMSPYTMKNRIINGDMRIDQRNAGASQTITGGASTLAFNCDRWQVRSQGANASVQQVSTNNTYRMVFTGLASNTGVAASQSIEAINCADMAGQTVTLSLLAKSTSLTSLTLEAYYANTTNTFGTWGSPTVTLIGSQAVTISTTESLVSYTFAVPAAATTGLQIRITSGALAATQTLTIGNVQLEVGSAATSFEWRHYSAELQLCQRYYFKDTPTNNYASFCMGSAYSATTAQLVYPHKVTMRTSSPTVTVASVTVQSATTTSTGISSVAGSYPGFNSTLIELTVSGFTARNAVWLNTGGSGASAFVSLDTEL